MPVAWSTRVRPAVGREQVDPGEHAHQVVDPERAGSAARGAATSSGPRDGRCSTRPGTRSATESPIAMNTKSSVRTKTVRNWPPVKMFSSVSSDVADVPLERVPERHRLGERVLVAERDRDHGVEGDEEEERQPRDAREGEQPPGPARLHASARLELRPGLIPGALALDAQLQELLVERELVGSRHRPGERASGSARA